MKYVELDELPAPSPRRKLALLIGIDRYQQGVPALVSAVRDVKALAQVLSADHGYEVRCLLDEQATGESIRQGLTELAREMKESDRVVVYFAGHGIAGELDGRTDGPQGYLLAQDAKRNDVNSFLPMTRLHEAISTFPCKHLLLLLDCCFAGAFRWGRTRSVEVAIETLYRERFERYERDPAWQVITSAAHDERALDTVAGGQLGSRGEEADHSPFTAALLRGLRGAADLRIDGQSGDGVILASELHLYLESAFERLEQRLDRPLQKPLLWSLSGRDKGQFTFLVPGRTPSLPSALLLNEANNPYRGLQSYEEKDQGLFFGRTAAIESLISTVSRGPMTVIVGASGTGKSSLVRAGLIPRLRSLTEPPWHILPPLRPGAKPLEALKGLAASLDGSSESLAAAVAAWCQKSSGVQLLLIIDQTEELITQGAAEMSEFLAQLMAARKVAGAQLHLVLTMRAEFEPHFRDWLRSDDTAPAPARFLIPHMTRAELREVIERPASDRVLYFDPPELVDQFLDEVMDTPGALPLLSFLLSEMYRASLKRPRDRTLSAEDYRQLGGVAGALCQRADALYRSYTDEADRAIFRNLLLRMVVPGDLARRQVLHSELEFANQTRRDRAQAIVERLLDERLLVRDRDSHGRRFIEPAHDTLVMGWPQLGRFLAEDKFHHLHHNLIDAVQKWEASGKESVHLWDRDPQLPQAVAMMKTSPRRLNRREQEFVRRSQRRKQRILGLALLVVLTTMVLLGTWLQRERSARQEIGRQKEEIQQRLLNSYVEQGRKLLVEEQRPGEAILWLHRAQAQHSRNAALPLLLRDALRGLYSPQAVLADHHNTIHKATYSPDGRRIVATGLMIASVWDATTGRPLAQLKGHDSLISTARFSPDGRRIVTASADLTSRIWDTETGHQLIVLEGHGDQSAAYSPDGRRIVTASWDKMARIYDAETGRQIATLKGHSSRIHTAVYSPTGRRVMTASDDGTARLWYAEAGLQMAELKGHEGGIKSATYSPDGGTILTVGEDNTARIWDAEIGTAIFEIQEPVAIKNASFSPDGRFVVTVNKNGTVRVWKKGQSSAAVQLGPLVNGDGAEAAAYSPDGHFIVSANSSSGARVWEAESGRLVGELRHGTDIVDAIFSPNGRQIFMKSRDGTAQIWKAEQSARLLAVLAGGLLSPVLSAVYSPDGRRILTSSADKTARIWEAGTGRLVTELTGHSQDPSSAEYSPDGRSIITASKQGTAWLWEAETGRLNAELKDHRGIVRRASFSRDSRYVVTASSDDTARVWEALTGKLTKELKGHRGAVNSAAFSPDGRFIVTASDDRTARVWHAETARILVELRGDVKLDSATYSPDGRRIVTLGESHAQLWEAKTGRLLATDNDVATVTESASFSPDGLYLMTSDIRGKTHIWDAESGRLLTELQERLASFRLSSPAGYSPDGHRIVTTIEELARVWDAETGRLLVELKGHKDQLWSAAFSPDGRQIVTASQDGTARIWDVSTESRGPDEIAKLIRCYVPFRFMREDSDVINDFMPSIPAECSNQ